MPTGTTQGGELPASLSAPGMGGGRVNKANEESSRFLGATKAEIQQERAAIFENVIQLIQKASLNPGGANFGNATKSLNKFFADTPRAAYEHSPKAHEYLVGLVDSNLVSDLETPRWTDRDARHIEDCMLYHSIASRVAGNGDDLSRVRRIFRWVVEQVQLVPAGSLGVVGMGQAYARPYDVLLRGMATESEGFWSERGWLFLSLCRQLGLDGGLVTYTPVGSSQPVIWCCAIIVDKKPYLFDPRVGLEIPDARGDGVATIEDAITDTQILDRMDLPGDRAYGTTRGSLLNSSSKVGILLDSSLRYYAPRMKLFQDSLAGKNQTILFRDPAEERDCFIEALGKRAGAIGFWELPMTVEKMLFTNPKFVEATQKAQFMFDPQFPLIYARTKQLLGETSEAIQEYVKFRFAENATFNDKKTPMPPEFQAALDVYATYFLGTCHMEKKDERQAQFFFEKTLQMLPEFGPGKPFFNMYRFGAAANLARLHEAKGNYREAIAYYASPDPTTQAHGNLLRARELVWRDPMATAPEPLPPAPRPTDSKP